MDRNRLLNEMLPYRMQAVEMLNLAFNLSAVWGASPMTLYAGDKLVVEGNLRGFTNPCIEAGIMHCRALLEFLGLCDRKGELGSIKTRRPNDVGIEHFISSTGVQFKKVTAIDAAMHYPGPSDEAKSALLAVFQVTNKGLAHVTKELNDSSEQARLIKIASQGVPVLMVGCFYKPMGLPAPNYKLTRRLRP